MQGQVESITRFLTELFYDVVGCFPDTPIYQASRSTRSTIADVFSLEQNHRSALLGEV